MGLILTLIVGGAVGWLASLVMKADAQMGVIANIVVGIVGSALGAGLFSLLGLAAYGMAARLLMGVVGAAVLIAILRAIGLFK